MAVASEVRDGDLERLRTSGAKRGHVRKKLQDCVRELDALGMSLPANYVQMALDMMA